MPRKKQPKAAAFFDLDRTIVRGASGAIYADELREVGVLPSRRNPAEPVLFKIFDIFGENWPSMMATRQGVRLTNGWDRAKVIQAAEAATTRLLEQVLPYARIEMAEHRAAGRAVVLATTTPLDWVTPLAREMGFDEIIATQYHHEGGRYTGNVDGRYIWGRGKSQQVQEWALENNIDLAESYAYSDSYYDVPLLSIVGHPNAVNPDPRLAVIAALRRWPTRFLDAPPGVPKLAGLEPQQVAFLLARPEMMPFVRTRIFSSSRIPASGSAIIVANHRSYFDPLAIGFALAKRGRPVRFLGKKEVFDAPLVGDFAKAMGGIRVDRGTGSDAPLRAAEEALAAGEMVAMMPQGTIPRGREFFNPELKGRWGVARLAHATGAPVIPMGLWGTELVWPRSSRFPNVTNVLHPPKVTVSVGRPVALEYDSLEADTERIMDAIVGLLPAVAREWHEPTDEEIARATPANASAIDDDSEAERRPGTV